MKKLYTQLAALAAMSLSALCANAGVRGTITVDTPANVTVTFNGEELTADSEGVFTISSEDNDNLSVQVAAKEGCALLTHKYLYSGQSEWTDNYISSYNQTNFSVNAYTKDHKITTGVLSDIRTAHATIWTDDPSLFTLYCSWSDRTIEAMADEAVSFDFVPAGTGLNDNFESIMVLRPKNYNDKIYKVTVNGNVISNDYGEYSLTGLTDGSEIRVVTAFPDKDVNFSLSLLNDAAQEGFIQGVTVGDTEVTDWSNPIPVHIGKDVKVSFNTTDFKVNSFTLNDESLLGYGGTAYSPYTISVLNDQDYVMEFDAKKYGDITLSIEVNNPELVTLYNGYQYQDNPIALTGKSTSFSVRENLGQLTLVGSSDVKITKVEIIKGENVENVSVYSNSISIYGSSLAEGAVIKVYDELIVRDDVMAFYFDSPAKASDSAQGVYGWNFVNSSYESLSAKINTDAGYSIINFGSVDGNLTFSVYNGNSNDTENVRFYINDEKSTAEYGASWTWTPANNDVVKVYVGLEEPEMLEVTMSIDNAANTPEVTVDKIRTASFGSLSVLPGTEIKLKAQGVEGDYFQVLANDDEVAADSDHCYTINVNAATAVKITSTASSGILDAVLDKAQDGAVYNLQGIRVDGQLPAGIYIRDGKKFMVK